ncbi:MAG: ribosome maturation factor RimP [Gammaproteobacteria bacterium]|nr:ribosome maturation factor RimP [Gammaproteobacteria bacterium]
MKNSIAKIVELIEPTVTALGLELWGIEHLQQGKYSLLRIYIEREAGVAIEDCEQVSKQVSALLDVEDPIAGEYTLEVSSPGLERPLFSARQFSQYIGSEVKLRLHSPVQGRRKFKGKIVVVEGDSIRLQADGVDYDLSFSDVDKANIVF